MPLGERSTTSTATIDAGTLYPAICVRPDTGRTQVVRQSVRPGVELREAEPPGVADQGEAFGDRRGDGLEQGCHVQRHGRRLEIISVPGNDPVPLSGAADRLPHSMEPILVPLDGMHTTADIPTSEN
ncbi:hypothetical protein [Microbispora catharanthi]|uniref:hypothetical protein n=1 Tax=Microbispora catharanthi TaxID=1712871 RepID=UPI00137818CD|nr:hypothetical protein [Microbispora catharanthi]